VDLSILPIKEFIMPEFTSPFTGLNSDRKLTHGELIRAIRFSIAAEYEAVQIYMQIAESINNDLAKKVLIDVATEEKEHAGEFMRVLRELSPEEFEHYKKGEKEVEEMMEEK
jgi:rubrerythrin